AKVDEQHRDLRVVETIQTQWNYLHRLSARRLAVNWMILGIEVARFNVALPVEQSLVSPRVRDVQKTLAVRRSLFTDEVAFRNPEQRVGRASVGHRERFEVE